MVFSQCTNNDTIYPKHMLFLLFHSFIHRVNEAANIELA